MAGVLNQTMVKKRSDYTLGLNPAEPNLSLHLFVNNRPPLCTDLPSDYTECTVHGYSSIALSPGGWNFNLANCVYTRQYQSASPPSFTFQSGGQTIYGHFVKDDLDGSIAWAELWSVPFVTGTGETVYVTLQFVDQGCV